MMHGRFAVWALALAGTAMLGSSCGTPDPRPKGARMPFVAPPIPRGVVIRVNPDDRYVIAECSVLPPEGWEFPVYRKGKMSARIKATGHRRGVFLAADTVEGEPQAGDEFGVDEATVEVRP